MTDKQLHLLLSGMLHELQQATDAVRYAMPEDAPKTVYTKLIGDETYAGDFIAVEPLNELIQQWTDRLATLAKPAPDA